MKNSVKSVLKISLMAIAIAAISSPIVFLSTVFIKNKFKISKNVLTIYLKSKTLTFVILACLAGGLVISILLSLFSKNKPTEKSNKKQDENSAKEYDANIEKTVNKAIEEYFKKNKASNNEVDCDKKQ